MRRTIMIATLLIAVAIAARPAVAAYSTGCCACLEEHKAMTSGPGVPEPALFCGLVVGMQYPDFVSRCEDQGGGSAPCFMADPGQSCTDALAAQSILCPGAPGAPTANVCGLTGLALALVAFGTLAVRRRLG